MSYSKSFLTVKEVAEMLRLKVITVYEFVKDGKLPAVRLGKSYRIAEKDLNEFLRENKVRS